MQISAGFPRPDQLALRTFEAPEVATQRVSSSVASP